MVFRFEKTSISQSATIVPAETGCPMHFAGVISLPRPRLPAG